MTGPEKSFRGTERFHVRQRLGEGGMGVVYRAYDAELDSEVALKTLRALDAAAIYRFKREFRALADISHPNLVSLHELVSSGDAWFFTMELVNGVDFSTWVRGPGTLDEGRLRGAILQLAEGVHVLHQNGRYHRDIKPSNVMVSSEGRLVLLDFGLVTMLAEESAEPDKLTGHVVGTIAYMAPEQAAGMPVTAASDWYAVGVMLFEALTGRLPFTGKPFEVLAAKQKGEAPAPSDLAPGVPEDLNQLAVALLSRDPRKRPDGAQILRRLGGAVRVPDARGRPQAWRGPALPGREQHLARLFEAFEAARKKKTVLVYIHGASGMGKSSLVRRFVDEVPDEAKALVFGGRCYERESVPFKALDSLIDSVSRHLMRLPAAGAARVLPRDILALSRVFPVLWRVRAVREAEQRTTESYDAQEERRRAFSALRELFANLGKDRPIVVHIDDLQWGDLDSAALLADLFRSPAPPLLCLLSYRAEDRETSAPLRALLDAAPAPEVEVHELSIEALSSEDARALARYLLADAEERKIEQLARESAGNPFFLDELARHARRALAAPKPAVAVDLAEKSYQIRFEDVLWSRVERLPPAPRRLLELVAVSGRPLEQATALRAADLGAEGQPALVMLLAEHLLRTRLVGEDDALEAYHDRIRESVQKRLPSDQLALHHRRLAEVLEATEAPDPEAMLAHLLAAGETERAAKYALPAARHAANALAFDRAASAYRRALELRAGDEADLQHQLGDALAAGGRGREAAAAYEHAAELTVDPARALDLRRAAAEQLLRSGHVDEGLAVLSAVLGEVGMALAPTPRRAVASLLVRRAQVRLRGLRFEAKSAEEIPPADLAKIDILWSVAMGLAMVDTARGSDFQSRHLLLALKSGERYRLARAMAMEACYSATSGGSAKARTAMLVAEAEQLAKSLGHPHAIGLARYAAGVAAFLEGRFADTKSASAEALEIFREQCMGAAWEIASAGVFHLWSLGFLGELAELSRMVRRNLREALERGDRYAAANLRTGLANLAWLIAGDPDGAEKQIDETMAEWSQQGFHIQHYYDLVARSGIDLYRGQGTIAHQRVTARWPELSRSLLLLVQFVRVDAHTIRARTALAAALETKDGAALLRASEKDTAKVEREKMPWSVPLASMLRGGIAEARGDDARAVEAYRGAMDGFAAAGMGLYGAVARWRWAELAGGDEGSARMKDARSWMERQGIVDPARIVSMLAPARGRQRA